MAHLLYMTNAHRLSVFLDSLESAPESIAEDLAAVEDADLSAAANAKVDLLRGQLAVLNAGIADLLREARCQAGVRDGSIDPTEDARDAAADRDRDCREDA